MPINQGQIDQMEAFKEARKDHERVKREVAELRDFKMAQKAQLNEAEFNKNRVSELELKMADHAALITQRD